MDKKRILIAEDDLYLRTLFQKAFKNSGYHVSTAVDGDSALESLNRELPDVLVLDIGLPGPSGLEILRYVRRHERYSRQLKGETQRRVNIIVVTGNQASRNSDEAALADAFMLKPISIRELLDCVQRFTSNGFAPSLATT